MTAAAWVLGCTWLVALEHGTDRAAVPLFRPPLVTPVETAGTGLAPEVTVEVELSAEGRPTSVDVLDIRPSSAHDELFAEVCRETLEQWRFAPPLVDGEPQAVTLRWTVQFPARHEDQHRDTYYWWRRPGATDVGPKIRAMPVEQRLEYFRQIASKADLLLNGETRREFSSDRFVVVTDAAQPAMAETLARNLEATFNILEGTLGDRIPPQPEPYKIRVYMYASRNAYKELQGQIGGWELSDGFYHSTGLVAMHQEAPTSEQLVGVMLHEATHAYIDRHVVRPGLRVPLWLEEGLAEYVQHSKIEDGTLVPGKGRRTIVRRAPYGAWRERSPLSTGLAELKQAIKNDRAPSLRQLVASGPGRLPDLDVGTFYLMSWLLIHYLRHGEPGWADDEFPAFLLYVAEGYPAGAAMREVYGRGWAEADASFRDYVAAM